MHIPVASDNLTKPVLPRDEKGKVSYINPFAYD
jgi:hypothetical protein